MCICKQKGDSQWFPCPLLPSGCDSGRCHARHLQAGPAPTLGGGGGEEGPLQPCPHPHPWPYSLGPKLKGRNF